MTSTPQAEDDFALVQRARSGNRAAFDQIYARHVRPVYWQAYAVVGNAPDAEDVTQDVFVTAWRKLLEIEIAGDSLLPWLLVTAKYVALNSRRKRLQRDRHTSPIDASVADPAASVEESAHQRVLMSRIDACVAALGDNDRALYELCIGRGRSYEQAAVELGVSHATVRNRLSRMRQRLRADLAI